MRSVGSSAIGERDGRSSGSAETIVDAIDAKRRFGAVGSGRGARLREPSAIGDTRASSGRAHHGAPRRFCFRQRKWSGFESRARSATRRRAWTSAAGLTSEQNKKSVVVTACGDCEERAPRIAMCRGTGVARSSSDGGQVGQAERGSGSLAIGARGLSQLSTGAAVSTGPAASDFRHRKRATHRDREPAPLRAWGRSRTRSDAKHELVRG